MTGRELWHRLGAWRARRRARRREQPRQVREQQRVGPAAQRLPRTASGRRHLRGRLHRRDALQLVVWLDVTRPERRDLLTEPVPDEVRTGFSQALSGMLLVFGAVMPLGMFAPRYAGVIWAVVIPLRLVVGRFIDRA